MSFIEKNRTVLGHSCIIRVLHPHHIPSLCAPTSNHAHAPPLPSSPPATAAVRRIPSSSVCLSLYWIWGLRLSSPVWAESRIAGKKRDRPPSSSHCNNCKPRSSSIVNVVAIVGQGGIGKSTLAKKVFASEAIKEEFKTKIWLSVTQQFTKVDLLRAPISQAGGNKHGDEKDETILVNALTDTLSNNKFLLVMDDVWYQQAWENVLRTPILNAADTQPGSRILVTSRKVDVVRSMGASILRVDTLDDEDAWCLLKKQLPQPQVSNSSVLQTSNICDCPKLKLLEGVAALDSMELDWEHWEVAGPDARCTPKAKRYQQAQDQVPRELPEDLVISRSVALNSLKR